MGVRLSDPHFPSTIASYIAFSEANVVHLSPVNDQVQRPRIDEVGMVHSQNTCIEKHPSGLGIGERRGGVTRTAISVCDEV